MTGSRGNGFGSIFAPVVGAFGAFSLFDRFVVDVCANYTYEECSVKRVKAVTAGQEKTRMSAAFTATADGKIFKLINLQKN